MKGVGRPRPSVWSGATTQSGAYPSRAATGGTSFLISEVYPAVEPLLRPLARCAAPVSTTPGIRWLYSATTCANVPSKDS